MVVACVFVFAPVFADGVTSRLDELARRGTMFKAKAPRFAFTATLAIADARSAADALVDKVQLTPADVTEAMSSDGRSAWIAANLEDYDPCHTGMLIDVSEDQPGPCCGSAPCPPTKPPGPPRYHVTALLEHVGDDWEFVAWHIAEPVTPKAQAEAVKHGLVPEKLAHAVSGAEEVVKLFESTIRDSAAIARTVSDRRDTVLFGSELAERSEGAAQVRAQLQRWKLAFKVRDGIRAGLTVSRTVAWVAANVDASSAKRPKDKPLPYRLLFVYEKTGATWKLVQAHFSVVAQ